MTEKAKRPAFQFYPADWRKDVELRACSLAARGLWIDLMCVAHECEPYGHLMLNGKPMTPAQIAGQIGVPAAQVKKLLDELVDNGVARRTEQGAIFSKRMVDDERLREQRAETGRANGAKGAEFGHLGSEHGNKGGRPKADNPPKEPGQEPPQNPLPSSSSSSSSSTSVSRARGARLPPDWSPDPDGLAFAEQQGLRNGRAQAELARFRDYWTAQPGQKGVKADWTATWRNWVRRAAESGATKPATGDVFAGAL
jgi:DnaT DNA-binding domain